MRIELIVVFSAPADDDHDFIIRDFISYDDFSLSNHWADISSAVSELICHGESFLRSMFLDGSDYVLSSVSVVSVDNKFEEVNTN